MFPSAMLSPLISPHARTNAFRAWPWLRLACVALALCMAGACASTGAASDPAKAAEPFVGRWLYAQSCGWEHSADLMIHPGSGVLEGSWADGTRVRGENGTLRGTPRDGKLFLRFCRDAEGEGADICPNFGPEESYLVRKRGQLVWYRAYGAEGYREYLTLDRFVLGDKAGYDDECPDDASAP